MNSVLKATNLDFALLKPYAKAICFVLLVPIVFTLFPCKININSLAIVKSKSYDFENFTVYSTALQRESSY